MATMDYSEYKDEEEARAIHAKFVELGLSTGGGGTGGAVDSVNGKVGVVVINKTDVGLANVDNTTDLGKPISTATQTALNAKGTSNLVLGTTAGTAKAGDYAPTKTTVGLGNVDNTSDAAKPVSTAQAAAINAKADTVHTHTKSEVGLSNVDNTSDALKPISNATQTALNAKGTSNLAIGITATDAMAGNKTFTKSEVGLGNVDNTSDLSKPISTATQTALDTKGTSNLAIGTTATTAMVGNKTFAKSEVGLANVDNTSDVNKPVSTAQQTALNGKANTSHVHSTADVTSGTLGYARMSPVLIPVHESGGVFPASIPAGTKSTDTLIFIGPASTTAPTYNRDNDLWAQR